MRSLIAFTAATIVAASPAMAQKAEKEPRRPSLKSSADTNDWYSYYQWAFRQIRERPDRAADALYWATRLDPSDARPLYALWVARWKKQPEVFYEYWRGAKNVINRTDVIQLDSLYHRALLRDPFLHQSLYRVLLQDHVPGDWSQDSETAGWLAYTEGRFDEALREFTSAMERNPKKDYLHYDRALTLYMLKQYDSAASELSLVVDALAAQDQKRTVYLYDSKAMYHFARARAYLAGGRNQEAMEALGRALAEDLSFSMAHASLGALAWARRDTAAAVTEYDLAIQLKNDDVVVHHDYGVILTEAGRYEEAAIHYRKAIELEPLFANTYYNLAIVLERLNKGVEALDNYNRFIERAPRRLERQIGLAKSRIAELARAVSGTSEEGSGQ